MGSAPLLPGNRGWDVNFRTNDFSKSLVFQNTCNGPGMNAALLWPPSFHSWVALLPVALKGNHYASMTEPLLQWWWGSDVHYASPRNEKHLVGLDTSSSHDS